MTNDNLFSQLLYLYNNTTIFFNLTNRIIEHYYIGNQAISNNISFDEFIEDYSKRFNFSKTSNKKLKRFFDNLVISSEPFSINANYELDDKSSLSLKFQGYKYDNDNVVMIISKNENSYAHSTIDYLTKILTREAMTDKINQALLNPRPFALLLIDIDNFKQFNDSYGHMYGDIVLVETASSIKKYIGNNGFVGRIGGDEFLVLLYVDNDYDIVHAACSNIRKAINNVSNHNIKKASITATVGCAQYPADGTTYDVLFKKTNKALYRGKRKGRNCFIIYDKNKCGDISDISTEVNNVIDSGDSSYENFNIISGVAEILNRDNNLKKNIEDALSLLGSYFLFDRISLFTLEQSSDELKNIYCWCNPRMPGIDQLLIRDKYDIPNFRNSLDRLGMLKLVQVESNKTLNIYPILHEQKTTAILAFEIKYMEKHIGMIRFDMCSINRFWQQNEISTLMVISKIFGIVLNRENERLEHIKELYYDRLTSIYNYIRWRDFVENELNNNSEYSLMYFNIEGYKHLNDIYGSKICDEALINLGKAFKNFSMIKIIFCRVTDDKFLVYIPSHDKKIIESLYEHIKVSLNESFSHGSKFRVVCGVYISDGIDILTTAIDKANIARKQPSIIKTGICYFSQEQFEEKKFKMELELHMFEAKKNDEFLLYLQPKFNVKTGQLVGAEALTRWFFKKETILTPNLFIPVFEQNGFIKELDFTVFENVCKFQRKVIDSGYNPITISVNLSRNQSDFNSYINTINQIRENYNVPPHLIELEITEGMYVSNSSEISELIKELHRLGYKVSMDDFGSGYSNLSALADMDFDLIKLDKGFCSNKDNQKEKVILAFIMELAHELDMDVLCEGVETKELMEYLRDVGCNIVQGFLFDKPIPQEMFFKKYFDNKN